MNEALMPKSSSTILQCRGLAKTFRQGDQQLEVLKEIDFLVHSGESVADYRTVGEW